MSSTPPPRITGRRTIAEGARFDFDEATVAFPDGGVLRKQYVRHPGAVCVLPILQRDGETSVVMIRNYRAAVDETLWELPAGMLEAGEPGIDCAARELIEETGFEAATVRPLGRFHTSPGLSDELMQAFVATDLAEVGQRLEPGEHIEVSIMRVSDVFRLIDEGVVTDAKTMLTVLLGDRAGLIGR